MSVTWALPFKEKIIPELGGDKTVDPEEYRRIHQDSLKDIETFWSSIAKELEWFKPWDRALVADPQPPFYKWFVGGRLNASYLTLDRHVKGGRKNKVAIIWESEPADQYGNPLEIRKLTYHDLWREVNRFAYVLRNKFGLRKGDTIGIYMPMIPELPITMLAAARLGVIFTVVFSGFTAQALADRLNDAGTKLVITTDGGYRRGRVIRLKEIVDKALEQSPTVKNVIVYRRVGLNDVNMVKGRDYWWHELMSDVPANTHVEPEPVESEHPLYILYTSGTTGKPKGIVHDTGGYMVLLHATMKWVFDAREDDIHFCTADIGWVTGHSYIVFGPLLEGMTTIMYEGAPDYPSPDRWWAIVERYGATILYTSPTGIRTLMRLGDDWVKKHDLSTIRLMHSVGEPINPEAWRWLWKLVGREKVPFGSTWWMTETGGILISHAPGLALVPLKPGTNGPPLPGIDADVIDDNGNPVQPGQRGYLVIRRPWPGMLLTIWRDQDRYVRTYWSKFPGMFYAGDYAVKDEDGYFWILGRADEVIKVAGHRLGTYELESALIQHSAVAEAAVVGVPDPVRGEIPVAYVVLKQGYQPSEQLKAELNNTVREFVGPIATLSNIFFVTKLPKTRSGKIMRRLVRAVVAGQPLGDVTTLEDEASVEEVKRAYEEFKAELEKLGKQG
ncbi:acetate--CoA ligase [Vulcanisaeta souniana]|uniref:Acetate--CoA ligase n=1 Tax=Vulcanisaeta souniana JCM 11219 TaxID=1293586 RepID=A0A830DZD6_9CREN|nr:acetate--CoA ligase [Vulcanisaeta souniana]BDR91637.1 acetyl-coenzyme A synthetase [Vulcanisaeta souniana JCM 11219]GGI71708.1 acetyl-coenzyme A synthetase [Vulcanisaeta souniana JCM 11219]